MRVRTRAIGRTVLARRFGGQIPRALTASMLALSLCTALPPAEARAQAAVEDDWLGADKALHFAACTALAGAGYGVTALFTDELALRLSVGGGVALVAGAVKELLDLAGLGTPSWRDFTWDVIGTATGLLVSLLIDLAVRALTGEPRPPDRPAEAPSDGGFADRPSTAITRHSAF